MKAQDILKRNKFKTERSEDKQPRRYEQTDGIEHLEVDRRKVAGEILRCAWPVHRKGSHQVKNCKRQIQLQKKTASYPKAKEYKKKKIAVMRIESEVESQRDSDSEDSREELGEESDSDKYEES